MTIPTIQAAVNAGEISPALFGRVDLDKYKKGCSTLRNMFASYRGGASSRAGTAFVGQCKQPATAAPPHLIPFQFSVGEGIALEFGDNYIRFAIAGAYVTETPIAITAITNANPGVLSVVNSWSNGDAVFITGCTGLTQLNGRIFIVANRSAGAITLQSTLTGANISTAALGAYTGNGTAARIYTLATPYAAADLPLLKWTQSADVMTLVHPGYAPRDLARVTNSNWTLTQTAFGEGILAPRFCVVSTTGAGTFIYQYVATAVDATTGEESVASPIGQVSSVNIATTAGTLTVEIGGVSGAGSYNFYRAPETDNVQPAAGALFGYVGTSLGTQFNDSNITPDFTKVPPTNSNPFAVSSITAVEMTSFGSTYSLTATITINTATGSGFAGMPVIIGGQIQWVIVVNGGQNYAGGDTPVFTDVTGTGAAGTLNIGPATGTWPGAVAYFQQRRFYAATTNSPDTYFASQPGAFTNMDSSIPVQDDDAIVGSPWSQQVNGIQWMVNMPGGLVILTGLGAWQLSGGGGGLSTALAITPSNQVANPQAYNGISPSIRPLTINYDILYVQEKGSIVRDLSYNFFVNIYTGTDMTVLSNHLFDYHTIVRWDWAEEPFKTVWAVRDDGVALCLTYLKEQDVYSWSRHDTNGLFQSVCAISEPPVNALYFVVKRLIQNNGMPTWAYYLERMDDRAWTRADNTWCVDAGLSLAQNAPNATLSSSSAAGIPTLNEPTVLVGGANYGGATFAQIIDPTGAGAAITLTVGVGGVITNAVVTGQLTGYSNPSIRVVDPSGNGTGAIIQITLSSLTTLTASAGVFSNAAGQGAAGDVVRMGNGMMTVVTFVDAEHLVAAVMKPITTFIQNDPLNTVIPAAAGAWTIAVPITTVSGLDHLEGMTVSILADGIATASQVVQNGQITLSVPASSVLAGLGFTAQLQTLYWDAPSPATVQGRRKSIFNVSVRIENTIGPFEVGANQPDASTQPGEQNVPWSNMTKVNPPFGAQSPIQPYNLFHGDIFTNVKDALGNDKAQIAIQQTLPLPISVLAVMPWVEVDDDPGA